MGTYHGAMEVDCTGKIVLPGFIDAHIHLESSLVSPSEFMKAVLPHGTTAVITDPHEIANEDNRVLEKIAAAQVNHKIIDGHAPGLTEYDLNAYSAAGIYSDHECHDLSDAIAKIQRGQHIMIREGTAARNLEALMPLLCEKHSNRCMFCTDDKHPNDLLEKGHIDYIVKMAISLGADPMIAVKVVSYNAARYFSLSNREAIAPGYLCDLVLMDRFHNCNIEGVYKEGALVAEYGQLKEFTAPQIEPRLTEHAHHTFQVSTLSSEDFANNSPRGVIGMVDGEITTTNAGIANEIDLKNGILKIAVIERHKNTHHIGIGFMKGYGLKTGAVATSMSHDSHNIIVVGSNEADMADAVNRVVDLNGGIVVWNNGQAVAEVPRAIAGIMSDEPLTEVNDKLEAAKERAHSLGVGRGIDPFMTLSFMALPVIPTLRITTKGVFDVIAQKYIEGFTPQKGDGYMRRFFCAVLTSTLCCSLSLLSSCGTQPTGYTAYAEILDAGGFVKKIVIPMKEKVSSLAADDFTLSADLIDLSTGKTAQVPESDYSVLTEPAAGPIEISRAYLSDKAGNEVSEGRYVTIETVFGPQYPLSAISYYAYGYTRMADCRYSISYQGQLLTDQGELIIQGKELISTGKSESGLNLAWIEPQIKNDAPPLIIWLHGAGEGGTDPYVAMMGNRVINLASKKIQSHFGGAYVLAPQCDTMWMDDGTGNYSSNGSSCWNAALMSAIEEFIGNHPEIDRNRIYLGGCSNGGFMTLRMLMDYPGYFAAAFPTCQAMMSSLISDEEIEAMKNTPIWFTHAKNDTTVPANPSTIAVYDRLVEAGAQNVYLSLYENVIDTSGLFLLEDGQPYQYPGHATWIYVLNDHCRQNINGYETTIFQWLAQQEK